MSRVSDYRYAGVAEARVVHVGYGDGDDNDNGLGQVRMQVQWLDTRELSDWCRVVQLHAGRDHGAFWLPEPGDEVLVAFRHGDPRVMYVLGSLYNAQAKPAVPRTRDHDEKSFRTKAGHRLVLDDTSDHRRIEVRTAAGHHLLLDDTAGTIELAADNGPSITFTVSGDQLTIKAGAITIEATTGDLVLKSAQKIRLN